MKTGKISAIRFSTLEAICEALNCQPGDILEYKHGAKLWLVSLQEVQKKKYSTIHTIRGVLRPAFRMAVEDDLLPKSPFDFELGSVIVNDSVTREAISKEDEIRMMEFIKNDNHFCKYYDAIYILFNTGMRISEFCGLTLDKVECYGIPTNHLPTFYQHSGKKYAKL